MRVPTSHAPEGLIAAVLILFCETLDISVHMLQTRVSEQPSVETNSQVEFVAKMSNRPPLTRRHAPQRVYLLTLRQPVDPKNSARKAQQ